MRTSTYSNCIQGDAGSFEEAHAELEQAVSEAQQPTSEIETFEVRKRDNGVFHWHLHFEIRMVGHDQPS